MYIVEWYDHEGNRHEQAFTSQEEARETAAQLGEQFDHVAILWEAEV